MKNSEKLKRIQAGYRMLVPCVKNNAVNDYALVLVEAPNLLTEMIEAAEKEETV